ncbi:MAG: helix-turn-helix transcriptional regulator [Lachnospiraceae bacterium]|nr:helix-turn-helix transcriptional regulator [Lachnospiraceae bacterium]
MCLILEKGYYGTSTREIARQAGVSSGLLFYAVFPSSYISANPLVWQSKSDTIWYG